MLKSKLSRRTVSRRDRKIGVRSHGCGRIDSLESRRLLSVSYLSAASVATYNSANNVLTVSGPTVFIADPGAASAPNVVAVGSTAAITFSLTSVTQIHLAGLNLSGGATLAEPIRNPITLELAGPLAVDSTSAIDVGTGSMVVAGGNLTQIDSLISRGFNVVNGGGWNGTGITSSIVAASPSHLTSVGAVSNSSTKYPGFLNDPSIGSTDILVRYTLFGDANLDGKVDGSDYGLIDAGYTNHLTGWYNGDFNYDGTVDGSDYSLTDNAFENQQPNSLTSITFYVSPTGSDNNSGLSPQSPWQSVKKVDSTVFSPGDQILFQYGGTWNGSLNASASGTTTEPITYSAYGTASAGNPIFNGSDTISSTAFTLLTGSTYTLTPALAVNWVYDNNVFLHEAQDASGSGVAATDLAYVENTTGTFFYNASNNLLYVNAGSNFAAANLALGTRADAIFNDGFNNLVFDNLSTMNTAQDSAGYGIRDQNGANVTIENATVTNGGKHGVGVIDGSNFTGNNLSVVNLQPDLGFGGASAYVAFSDYNSISLNNGGDNSTWNNLQYYAPGSQYEAFISHGVTGSIGTITINNLISLNGYGTGVDIENSSATEKVILTNSQFSGGAVSLNTQNSVLDHLIMSNNASVLIAGTNNVVQNCYFETETPDLQTGDNGAIVDSGTGNTIRFNTFNFLPYGGPAVGESSPGSGVSIYGNVFNNPQEIGLVYNGGSLTINANYNIYAYYGAPNFAATFESGTVLQQAYYSPLSQWQSLGNDPNSLQANASSSAVFNADGDSLAAGSLGTGFVPSGVVNSTLAQANSLLVAENGNGTYNAGVDNTL